MIAFGLESHASTMKKEAVVNGSLFRRRSFMEGERVDDFAPTSVLIEQPPGAVLPAHFHRENQFQVFVQGSGSIGKQPLAGCVVHYAGAYTGYGPIAAGPEGLSYFTLRAQYDFGAGFLPAARSAMLAGPKAHATSEAVARDAQGSHALLGDAQGPLYAEQLRLAAGEKTTLAECAWGQFVVVLEGTLTAAERKLEAPEQLFFANEALALEAGDAGCHLLVLRIPPLDEAYAKAQRPGDEAFTTVSLRPQSAS
ncbi:hypothetical protein [Ramlibacter sp.]|uniref:hypothetical protein n=1 Tax=Ramlibacter sp. TaxID=1917967 RepID=UPI003D105021